MRSALVLLAFLTALVLPRISHAHEVNFGSLEYERPNIVHLNGGAEQAFVMGLGYSRVLRLVDRPLVLTGDVRMPIALPDFGDYRIRVAAQTPIIDQRGGVLAARVMPTLRGASNDVNRMVNVGTDIGLIGGYYRRRWFVAGELGVDWAISTHIKHTELYRDTIYADAKDGWYANTAVQFYYSLLVGYSPGPVDLILRVGQSRHFSTGRTGFLPLHATLGVAVRFGDIKR